MGRPKTKRRGGKAIREELKMSSLYFVFHDPYPICRTGGECPINERKADDPITHVISITHRCYRSVVFSRRVYATGATGAATGVTPRSTPSPVISPLVAFEGPMWS